MSKYVKELLQSELEKKIAKKEAKMRKKGVFLGEVVTPEEPKEEEKPEDFEVGPWARKSTEAMPFVERKIDRLAMRTERSRLHELFEEKYGESLKMPTTYKEYELSEAEKARLEKIGVEVEEAKPTIPVEAVSIKAEEEEVVSEEVETVTEEVKEAEAAEGEAKPIYHPLQLWLYTKYGKDKMIVLKVLILLVSIIGFVLLLIPRIVIFLIMFILNKIKARRAEKKTEKTEKVPSEA